jgi:hypothetical protein
MLVVNGLLIVTPHLSGAILTASASGDTPITNALRYSLQTNNLNAGMLIRATLIFIPHCCTALLVFIRCIGAACYRHRGASKTAIAGYL